MRSYWADKRLSGKPLEPGTVCYVMDPEDGTIPVETVGPNAEDVMERVGLTAMHARVALERRAASQERTPAKEPLVMPKKLTADEVFQLTEDTKNPATAGKAIAKLVEDATGVDLNQIAFNNFLRMAEKWGLDHPEFYKCETNKKLVMDQVLKWTKDDFSLITPDLLTRAFTTLRDGGFLVERPAGEQFSEERLIAQPFPVESQVQRAERQRSEQRRQGTGMRSTQFSARQTTPPRGPKYTKDQVDRMSLEKVEALVRSGDKDWADSCEYWYPSEERATA